MLRMLCLLLFIVMSYGSFSQHLSSLDSLRARNQRCLGKGTNMLGCSQYYYYQVDSMLNRVYQRLRAACDSLQRENLRDEELEWLEKRDTYFRKTRAAFLRKNPQADPDGSAPGAQDDAMFMYQDNTLFAEARLEELMTKKPLQYTPGNYLVMPSGYYELENKLVIKNGDTWGRFGDIKVKLLGKNRLVVRLFVCKGAPSYNMGTLADTLHLEQNKAVFSGSEYDSTCRIVFHFYRRGIFVTHFAADYNFSCGFGHGVIAYGYYRKKSASLPKDSELLED